MADTNSMHRHLVILLVRFLVALFTIHVPGLRMISRMWSRWSVPHSCQPKRLAPSLFCRRCYTWHLWSWPTLMPWHWHLVILLVRNLVTLLSKHVPALRMSSQLRSRWSVPHSHQLQRLAPSLSFDLAFLGRCQMMVLDITIFGCLLFKIYLRKPSQAWRSLV